MDNDNKQSRRSFIKTGAGALGGMALALGSLENLSAEETSTGRKPNLVVFLGEGARWDEYSFAGNPIIQTPNHDRLAREGMVFRNAFVTHALCLPSRASTLTGLYSHSTGNVDNHVNQTIRPGLPLISDLLWQAGYEVAFFGRANVDVEDRYWDYYFGFKNWVADYNHPVLREGIAGQWSEPKTYDGYVDDLVTDLARTKTREAVLRLCLVQRPARAVLPAPPVAGSV
jgi:arylsulfatase A-like enzyme